MRFVVLIVLFFGCTWAVRAQSAPTSVRECLPAREMQEAVAKNSVVAPASAIMTARRQVPNGDVLRANLCRSDEALVYVIMALQKDGRIVQVMVDGPSGTVKSVR